MSRMIPSPDWFIGIDSFDLCVNGNWLDSITIEVCMFNTNTLKLTSIQIKHRVFCLFLKTHGHSYVFVYTHILSKYYSCKWNDILSKKKKLEEIRCKFFH